VRALWEARDSLAEQRDLAPGRVLPDSAIVDAAVVGPQTVEDLTGLSVFRGRAQRRLATYWWSAVERARRLPDGELPSSSASVEGPPPVGRWADRDPDAAARLAAARALIATISEQTGVPVENLLQPDLLRRLCWRPPEGSLPEALRAGGARPWQVELLAPRLADSF
jgi:ribonuclease D